MYNILSWYSIRLNNLTVFQRNERREREQRELAKAQAAARKYSECYSDDVYSSCSASESDSFQQVKLQVFFIMC